MPLIKIKTVGPDTLLALWQMTESVEELAEMTHFIDVNVQSINRQKEIRTEYCLLKALTGNDYTNIRHQDNGQPILDDYEISISHTRGWAAVILSKKGVAGRKKVGVDIEYMSTRVNKVVDRFIRDDEQKDTLAQRLINWSAKETVYKLLSEEDLEYFEMRLHPFTQTSRGKVDVDDLKEGGCVRVDYIINDQYVLTWAQK